MKVATRQLGYLISNKSTLENLKNEVENLQEQRKRVDENLTWHFEKLQTQSGWSKRVDDIFERVNAFSNYYEGKGACLNLLWRYRVGKQAQKMKLEISQLYKEGEFYLSVKPTRGPKSRTDTINDIMATLKDTHIKIVGVWGLGGGGTTSLAKQVGEQAKEQNLFDVVVITTITEKPNVEQAQRDIASALGLQFLGETHVERRNKLRQRIKKEKRILVIVDYIGGDLNAQELDLEEIGIPLGNEYKGCKLLLTSGNLDLIRNMSGDPKVFQLEVLQEDEALSLFEKMVGGVAQDSETRSIVKEIVKSCAGSAHSTFAVAKALRNKSLGAWKDALIQLKDNVSPIEICYNSLGSEELKYLLLLLTIRGRRAIHRYSLYADMWAGLFKNLGTSKDARNKCDSLISDLKAYGLVVEDGKECVKIIDLIWETAYSIAQRDLKASTISAQGEPEEWLRSLHFCNMTILSPLQVPERLQCPELQEIMLSTQSPSIQVSDSFFEETKLLKVLDFVGFDCSKLPLSIGLLTNLQALSMYNCKLGDIATVGELSNLRMLGLLKSRIQQLPRQIGQLQKLLILDLRDTYLQVIPPNVLSNLTSLEELYLRNSFCNWEAEGSKKENNYASLNELRNLDHLAYIEDLHVPNQAAWSVDLFFEKVKSYTIFIGDRWGPTYDGDHVLKTLKLKLNRRFQFEDGIKKMLKNVDVLYLDELNGVENVLNDLDSDGFPHLQSLVVQQNAEIKCIAICSSSHPLDAFPNLEALSLNNLSNLEYICHGPLTEKSFFKIKVIKVQQCDAMTCLFSHSMIRGLPHLADLEISECKCMKAIVQVEDQDNPHLEFPQLRSLTLRGLPALISFNGKKQQGYSKDICILFDDKDYFPNLETMVISGAHQLYYIWDPDIGDLKTNSFLKLKNVNIIDCDNLRSIFTDFLSKDIHNLKTLEVRNCRELWSIFRMIMRAEDDRRQRRLSLQVISINLVKLPTLPYVCNSSEPSDDRFFLRLLMEKDYRLRVPIEFPELEKVHLEDLPIFRSFSEEYRVESPSLGNVVVNGCPKLKKFGLGKIEKSQLKSVIVDDQEQVYIDNKVADLFELSDQYSTITKYNVEDDEELTKTLDNIQPSHFTNLTWFRAKNCNERLNELLYILLERSRLLEYLIIEQCNGLKFLYFSLWGEALYFPRLKELRLMDLPQFKSIWKNDLAKGFGLNNVQRIHIKRCPLLRDLITPTAVKQLYQLNELKIEECEMLEKVVCNKEYVRETSKQLTESFEFHGSKVELVCLSKLVMFHDNDYVLKFPGLKTLIIKKCPELEAFTIGFAAMDELSITDGKSFIELNKLTLDSCSKLIYVISSQTLQELGNLKYLTVSHCNAMKIVFKIQGEISHSVKHMPLNQLSKLTLTDLPNLIHIVNEESTRCYPNLQILQVKRCKSLNWIGVSLMLTDMEISDCEAMEKIIIMDKGEETREKTIFSQLKYVSLENLTKLSTFFPSTSVFPSLERLIIANCPALMTFVKESPELEDPLAPTTSNYFFPNSLSLDKLKVLHVINQDFETLWQYNCPPNSFSKLENMNLSGNNKFSSVISSNVMVRYNNLKHLAVDKCELLTEVFNLEDVELDQNIEEMLPHLRLLALSNLSGLTSVWNKEPQVPFFRNLVSLHIIHCDNLKSLFSLSAAKNLWQLRLLKLYNCEKMTEVISCNRDENVSITFPEVECLVLKDLPNLTSFSQQSGTFHWPKLQTVRVSNIPQMEIFFKGHLNTPLLGTISTTFVKKCWHGNLNKTISYLHANTDPQT